MTINLQAPELKELTPRIIVLGVGGAGGNAINGMIESGLQGVEFIAVNTDAQDLKLSRAHGKIQLGMNLTKGLGAGAKLDIGHAAADESLNDIINHIQGANMVFITAGMGGGTGTGAAHVIARAAKELNILTVGVVTLPFLYEGPLRTRRATQGLDELRKHVDTIIVIPNQNLFKIASQETTFEESFELSNDVLLHGVQSITDLMVRPGLINLDFADVETVMSGMGKAMMGTGESEGENRSVQAAELAINNPLIDDYSLKGAKGLLINITGGKDLKLFEVDEAVNKVRAEVDPECELIIGAITDSALDGKLRVSIVATALDGQGPETKSVINMVHRIQNRNPGYSDYSKTNSSQVISSGLPAMNSTEGANALQLEKEIENQEPKQVENLNMLENTDIPIESVSYLETNNIVHDQQEQSEVSQTRSETQDENKEDSPRLFSDEENNSSFEEESENIEDIFSDNLLKQEAEEEDYEIPAFLRKQKN